MEYDESGLTKKGTPVAASDLLTAAHARSLDLTLITNNINAFFRRFNSCPQRGYRPRY